jgi:hypothetical protein
LSYSAAKTVLNLFTASTWTVAFAGSKVTLQAIADDVIE